MAFRAIVSYQSDRVLKASYTVFCEDAVITKIEPQYNKYSGHTDVALFLDYSIRNEENGETTVKNGKVQWFIPENRAKCGYSVGDIFPIMISPKDKRAISVDCWLKLLRNGAQYTIVSCLGVATIIIIVVQLLRGAVS